MINHKSATNVDLGRFAAAERNHHVEIVPALDYNVNGLVKAKSAIKQRSCMCVLHFHLCVPILDSSFNRSHTILGMGSRIQQIEVS
jgi:hypothetical protein